jgi:nitroreductase
MDLDRVIVERKSQRKYTEDPVSDEDVQTLVEAGQAAPSWANTQCVHYVVVRDARTREALAGTLPEKNPARKALGQAPVALLLVAQHGLAGYYKGKVMNDRAWYMFDAGLAMQNICLKAHAMGLGTVIVGHFDHDKAGEVIGLPEGFETVALTPVGIPRDDTKSPPRYETSKVLHRDSW